MKTRQMAMDSVLAAMCAALGALALDLGSIKITLESLPVLLGALLFGPLDGMAIGFVGTFLYQLLRYGISATTVLWILPYCVCGLIMGWYAKKHRFALTPKQVLWVTVLAEVVVTTLNTGVLYLDSQIYGYYFHGFISAMLLPRYGVCVAKALVYGAILPTLARAVRRIASPRSRAV